MSKPHIKPLGNRVLVKRAQAETKTESGIFLPDTAQEKPRQGTVLAVGPGKQREEGGLQAMEIKEGDQVLFNSYAGTAVKNAADEEEFLIMNEEDILAILN